MPFLQKVKLSVSLFLSLLVVGVFLLTFSTNASAGVDKPLIVIRFNSDVVDFSRTLNKTVQRALTVKPATFFDVISITPDTGDDRINEKKANIAYANTQKIVTHLQKSGVKENRIRITYQNSPEITDDEVHIFVR